MRTHLPAAGSSRLGAVGQARRAESAAVVAASFMAGSVPFAQIVARLAGPADLRETGNGTVSASGLQDLGTGTVIVAGILDVAKGTIGPQLARRRGGPALAVAAGAAAIVGHNWSPFLRGAGGRGVSPALGTLLVTAPEGTLVLLAGLAAGRVLGETAIGALAAYAALGPVLARTRGRTGALTAAALLTPMLVKRLLGNRPAAGASTYLWRLLLDRDQPERSR